MFVHMYMYMLLYCIHVHVCEIFTSQNFTEPNYMYMYFCIVEMHGNKFSPMR